MAFLLTLCQILGVGSAAVASPCPVPISKTAVTHHTATAHSLIQNAGMAHCTTQCQMPCCQHRVAPVTQNGPHLNSTDPCACAIRGEAPAHILKPDLALAPLSSVIALVPMAFQDKASLPIAAAVVDRLKTEVLAPPRAKNHLDRGPPSV